MESTLETAHEIHRLVMEEENQYEEECMREFLKASISGGLYRKVEAVLREQEVKVGERLYRKMEFPPDFVSCPITLVAIN